MLKGIKVTINNKKIIMDILSNSYKYIKEAKNSIGAYFDLQTCERLISNELSHSFKIYLEKINFKKENNCFVFSELLVSIDEITKYDYIIKKFNILDKWSTTQRMYADIGIFLKEKK